MHISTKDWINYINRLSQINNEAAEKMTLWIQRNGFSDKEALVNYAYALIAKYGEGSASLSADMYDAVIEMENAFYDPAQMAATATYGETAKAMYGTMKQSRNPKYVGSVVGRLVKQAGADTMIKNAIRDGVEWAWIPNGDTCPYCIMLASRGWQKATKKVLKGDHADHIHANCDCTFAIRSSRDTKYDSYNPDKYLEMYENAEGGDWQTKVNSMRRIDYAKNKESINAQKREAYAKRADLKQKNQPVKGVDVTGEYREKATPGKGRYQVAKDVVIQDKIEHRRKVETANILVNEIGGEVMLLPEKDNEYSPDYSWNGLLWDLKTTSTEKAANSAIRHGLEQIGKKPGGVILNYGDNPIDMEKLHTIIDKRMGWNKGKKADIMIIQNGKIREVIRYDNK